MLILLFFAKVVWAWELKLNFQRHFVVSFLCYVNENATGNSTFLCVPSLTDYSLFQTHRLNIFFHFVFSGIFHSLVPVFQCHQSPFSVFLAGDL